MRDMPRPIDALARAIRDPSHPFLIYGDYRRGWHTSVVLPYQGHRTARVERRVTTCSTPQGCYGIASGGGGSRGPNGGEADRQRRYRKFRAAQVVRRANELGHRRDRTVITARDRASRALAVNPNSAIGLYLEKTSAAPGWRSIVIQACSPALLAAGNGASALHEFVSQAGGDCHLSPRGSASTGEKPYHLWRMFARLSTVRTLGLRPCSKWRASPAKRASQRRAGGVSNRAVA